RTLHLQESFEPAFRKIDFVFKAGARLNTVPCCDAKATRPDGKLGAPRTAQFLQRIPKLPGEVDVRRAVDRRLLRLERCLRRRQPKVRGFVRAERLKEKLVGMHRDDGIEYPHRGG